MRSRWLGVCGVLLFLTGKECSGQESSVDLNAIVQETMKREGVVGASVLVARGKAILLHKGYGFADLGLEVPTKDETVYHIVGPMLPFTGIAVLQQM
ncbi:MAG: serine hydrolase, partial [Candidatus Acidiferrum sp.]